MWAAIGIFVFLGALVATWIVTEFLRNIVDARRVRRTGIGGTQDLAMAATAISFFCLCGALVCWVIWIRSR